MNLQPIIHFRRQVEDLVQEQIALAEWERSKIVQKREQLQEQMQNLALDLERNLKTGIQSQTAEEHFRTLEELSRALEQQMAQLNQQDQAIAQLRDKLQEAYQARRSLEILQGRRDAARMRHARLVEQKEQDEMASFRFYQSGFQQA